MKLTKIVNYNFFTRSKDTLRHSSRQDYIYISSRYIPLKNIPYTLTFYLKNDTILSYNFAIQCKVRSMKCDNRLYDKYIGG